MLSALQRTDTAVPVLAPAQIQHHNSRSYSALPSAETGSNADRGAQDMATATTSRDGDVDHSLVTAEQSCQECRRRKAKCDRSVPTCGLCHQYRRHCVYEKHSRTPLTRKCVSLSSCCEIL